MFSACEDCLSVFPAEFDACPVCRQGTDWLVQTYDVDAIHVCSSHECAPVAVK